MCAWPEAGFDTRGAPRTAHRAQTRLLTLLFWIMFAPLAAAFIVEPTFKVGSTMAGVFAVAYWIRRDMRRSATAG